MAVSGWFVALLAVGVVPVVLLGGWLGARAVAGRSWSLVVTLDLVSPRPRAPCTSRASCPRRVRLGETVPATLLVTNPGGRTIRGLLRDAWQPSAGARPAGGRSAARRRAAHPPHHAHPVPPRRAPRRARHGALVRAAAASPRGRRPCASPASIRVLPPFHSRKHLPSRLARLRELDGRTSVMVRGQGTEFDSLREYVRGDDVRSIDWRATARDATRPAAG